MSIVSSVIVSDRPQTDGRRFIRERHTDHLGDTHDAAYLAEVDTDEDAVMAVRAAKIEAYLREAEINTNLAKALNGETVFTTQHSTVNQNLVALRELFRTSTKWELLTLAWVVNEVGLTDNQLKNLFSVNDAQLPTLKTKLASLAAKYEDTLDEVGQ